MQRHSPKFWSQQNFSYGRYAGKRFPKFIEISMETPAMLVLIEMVTNMAAESQQTSFSEFCYKSVNLCLEELKSVTIILYCKTRTVQIAEFPEVSPFFKPTSQLSRPSCKYHCKAFVFLSKNILVCGRPV